MDENKDSIQNRWFIPLVMLILVFAMAARTPLDSDLWWHLRAGEATWQTGKPILVDTFSHTRAGAPWINHSWLSQVGMYLLFHAGSYLVLSAAVATLATLSMGLVYRQMEVSPILRAFLILLAISVAAPVWSPRPQLVSLVMFGVLADLLYSYKWRQRDYLWVCVPLFVLWSNLHGGYVLGFLLFGALIGGEMLNHLLAHEGREVVPWKGIASLGAWLCVAWLAVAINPNGIAMWTIPIKTVGVGVLRDFISEWQSPDFHQLSQQPFLWLLLVTLGTAGLSRRRLDGSDLLTVGGFAFLALLARRNYGPFAMVAVPVLARHLSALGLEWRVRQRARLEHLILPESWKRLNRPVTFWRGGTLAINALIIVLLAGAAIYKLYWVTSPQSVAKYNEKFYPAKAVRWIEANQPSGRMFNNYNWGGYLSWNLRAYPVFVDGRTDLYDDQFLREYQRAAGGEQGWEETLNYYGVNLVLSDAGSGLDKELGRSAEWVETYGDEMAVVYIRKR